MDAFSDKLNSDERVLLHGIGADGSLIRWCTREIEGLGWQVTNNRVHGDADDMMDAWTEDLYHPPKKTKWRLGQSRSRRQLRCHEHGAEGQARRRVRRRVGPMSELRQFSGSRMRRAGS